MLASVQDLQKVTAFSEVPEIQLLWLLSNARLRQISGGEYIFKKGDTIEELLIFIEGEASLKIEQKGNYKQIGKIAVNEISGFLPYSRVSTSIVYAEATKRCKVLVIDKVVVREMATKYYELTEALVHVMTSRAREFVKINLQAEKMMALGKLSAGLAHELNNPASAIDRSAKELKKQLAQVPEKFKRITTINASEEEMDRVGDVLFNKPMVKNGRTMGILEHAEKEDELEQWLLKHGVKVTYDLTETLLSYGIDIEELEKILKTTGAVNFPVIIEWVENVLNTERLVGEIQEAAGRITTLVQSIKSYTHMDQAPERQKTDIREGIQSTLSMLNHKLKHKEIVIDRQFNGPLPEPLVMVGEINQVWTNLIDNAVDAMEQKGILTIRARKEGKFVKVAIIDNGKGISEEHLNSIFDPFFTTKAVGEGTGMGLEVVNRIIQQHQGEINVQSKKGETIFTVCLPID